MVLTAQQTTAFFENATQMAIPHATMARLNDEGIQTVDDLTEFGEDEIKTIAQNIRRPTAGEQPLMFGAKSQQRLAVACDLVKYYETVGRPLTAANLQWTPVMKNFSVQWKALTDKKDEDLPETPKISRGLNVMKWSEAFMDYLHRSIGARNIPLAYVVRESPEVVDPCPTIQAGAPHAAEYDSVEAELIARASHTHALYRVDNSTVYYKMEEATRGTSYAASIKPFQRAKNGREAYFAILSQHAGEDKWHAELSKQDKLLHNLKWKGNGSYTLERHCAQHRNAYVQMQAATEHVPYQLPDEYTRVTFLLDSIESSDAELQAAMASVKQDKQEGGMRNDFEKTVATLLPADPVAKKVTISGNKRASVQISEAQAQSEDGANVSSLNIRSGKGPKTGVDLRYHKHGEYVKLSADQKEELREWRKTPSGKAALQTSKGSAKGKKSGSSSPSSIAAVVEQQVAKKLKAMEREQSEESKLEAYVMGVVKKMAGIGNTAAKNEKQAATSAVNAKTEGSSTTTFLRSILRSAKNKED